LQAGGFQAVDYTTQQFAALGIERAERQGNGSVRGHGIASSLVGSQGC
jgi:hypothetical protein